MKKQLFSRLANDHQILFCGMCSCLLSATTSILLGWDVKSSLDSMTIRLGSIVTTDMPIYVYLQHNSIWSDEISSHGQYTWKVLGFFFFKSNISTFLGNRVFILWWKLFPKTDFTVIPDNSILWRKKNKSKPKAFHLPMKLIRIPNTFSLALSFLLG